jgi:hypothetical protein
MLEDIVLPGEVFICVRDFPKYSVSNLGRFYSTKSDRIIFPILNKRNGYSQVRFCDRKTRLAHRVVFESFVSIIPPNKEINHINGIKTDNRLENIEAVSHLENIKHSHQLGLVDRKGEKNGHTKLSLVDVLSIRNMLEETNLTQSEIGKLFGLCPSAVSRIKNKSNWNY